MKKVLLLVTGCWMLVIGASAQTVAQRLQKAFAQFENDSQLKHAISSLYVIDANTREVVFDKNSQIGMAPASTQKIITSITAFELLGKNYQYQTKFGYNGPVKDKKLAGSIFVFPSGDPTFGSWRYDKSNEPAVTGRLLKAIRDLKIDTVDYLMLMSNEKFEIANVPDGWIWQDIGNYYGAGAGGFNWRENQYDLILRSGSKVGDRVEIANIEPYFNGEYELISQVTSAAKGTGDNAYIYFPAGTNKAFIRGTIPVDEKAFRISGSIAEPVREFQRRFAEVAVKEGIIGLYDVHRVDNGAQSFSGITDQPTTIFHTELSPPLDSIIYWFNKKSINLYGEALIKTLAYEKQGFGSTDSGISILKKFWKEKGLDENELNMYDGSGLSPLNRVTTHAQVEILKYAKTRPWFQSFYYALPEYNGMKIKSGTISDVKGFCGYHKAKDGKEYIFSFLVNNYSGRTSPVVSKMYKVLDELK